MISTFRCYSSGKLGKFTFSARGKGKVEVWLDKPDGTLVASGTVDAGNSFKTTSIKTKAQATGEHAVFVAISGNAELDWWTFGTATK